MKNQKENSHANITWSEIKNKMYKLKRSILYLLFIEWTFFFLFFFLGWVDVQWDKYDKTNSYRFGKDSKFDIKVRKILSTVMSGH